MHHQLVGVNKKMTRPLRSRLRPAFNPWSA